MSSANTLVTDDAAYLVTDGGLVDLTSGVLLDVRDSVVQLSDIKTAFKVLGGAWIAPFLQQDAAHWKYRSYQRLLDGIVSRLPSLPGEVRAQIPEAPEHWGQFAVVLIGWEAGPRANVIFADDTVGAMKINTLPAARFVALPSGGVSLKADDIEGSAVRLLEAQRRAPVKINGHNTEAIGVSGFCQLTTVNGSGISSRILHRWPDVVGERVSA